MIDMDRKFTKVEERKIARGVKELSKMHPLKRKSLHAISKTVRWGASEEDKRLFERYDEAMKRLEAKNKMKAIVG